MSADMMERVVAAYESAMFDGLPPTKTAAAKCGLSYDMAAKYVLLARRAGLLPATSPGRSRSYWAGQRHYPVSCVIDLNGPDHRAERVCNDCVTRWPCEFARRPVEVRA